jgi:hypothetical protein
MILADEVAVIFKDRNPGIVLAFPVLPTIDIVHKQLKPPTYERKQLLDQ